LGCGSSLLCGGNRGEDLSLTGREEVVFLVEGREILRNSWKELVSEKEKGELCGGGKGILSYFGIGASRKKKKRKGVKVWEGKKRTKIA